MQLKSIIKPFVPSAILNLRRLYFDLRSRYLRTKPFAKRLCPICDYVGFFGDFGMPPRIDARCPSCGALERHRLFWLWFCGDKSKVKQPVLHFAPEESLERKLRAIFENYSSADLFGSADLCINIERIKLQSSTIKTVICNHVLEHVDDIKALSEIYRVLTADGVLICSVPIIEGWEKTYEYKDAKTAYARELHYGQHDHLRYYGRDFRDRLENAGFAQIEEYTAEGEACVRYGLLRGEKIFICSKS